MKQDSPVIAYYTMPIERKRLNDDLVAEIVREIETQTNGAGKVKKLFREKLSLTAQIVFKSYHDLRMNGVGIAEHTEHMKSCMRDPDNYLDELRTAERCAQEAEERFNAKIIRIVEGGSKKIK